MDNKAENTEERGFNIFFISVRRSRKCISSFSRQSDTFQHAVIPRTLKLRYYIALRHTCEHEFGRLRHSWKLRSPREVFSSLVQGHESEELHGQAEKDDKKATSAKLR